MYLIFPAQLQTLRSNISLTRSLSVFRLDSNWFSLTSSKLGYLNSKLMLRWDSHFNAFEGKLQTTTESLGLIPRHSPVNAFEGKLQTTTESLGLTKLVTTATRIQDGPTTFVAWYSLTRVLGRGVICPHLFFADSAKTEARSADIFSVPASNWIKHLVSKLQPQVTKDQVTMSGQSITGLTLRLRSGHTIYPIGFKLSAFHKIIDTYNLYISDFLYLWPEARSNS